MIKHGPHHHHHHHHNNNNNPQVSASMAQPQQQCSVALATGGIPTTDDPPAPPSSASSSSTWPLGMLEPPRVLANGMEVSVHACTRSMAREVKYIFPHLKPRAHVRNSPTPLGPKDGEEGEEVLIIPTIQKSRVDTVRFGVEVEEEKDRCLEYFADFAKPLCQELRAQGHWADYIDPCSGLPVLTPHCTRPYSEVAGFEHLLRYKTQNAGCCKILLHPRWGSSCYPATIFTTAPLPALREAMRRQERQQAAADGAQQ